MIPRKSFSKNKEALKLTLKRQRHNSLKKGTIQKLKKSKKTKSNRHKITKNALSTWYVFGLLSFTAIALMIIYYQSILIYWQQTYHFDLLNSNSLTVQEISAEQLENDDNKDGSSQENVFITENTTLTQLIDIISKVNEDKTPKTLESESNVIKKEDNIKTEVKIEDQVGENQKDHVGDKIEPQQSTQTETQTSVIEVNESTQTNISEVPELHYPIPISLTENDKVFFAGDSLMQGVAPYVKKMLFKQYKIESINLSKQSTGLAYPSAFDWPKTINDNFVADPSIKLLVVFLGPNDPWDFPVKGYVKYARFKSELWEEQYRLRIAAILNSAREHNVQVLWLAAPCMRKVKLNDGMIYLNSLYKSELEKAHQHFLTTNNLLGCTYEKFSNFVESDKEKIKVRVDDGIHFTPKGQKILANAIMEAITFKKLEDTNSE